jgi:SAM-dependent methyltransferase
MTAERQFPVPTGIPSAVTLPELALLQRYAHEAGNVLEIGTLYGFTCIGMALAGAHVTSVDPHYEGSADHPDTWEQFLFNCRRRGFEPTTLAQSWRPGGDGAIQAIHAPIEDTAADMRYVEFGMVFIDGNHTWPCPMRDAEIALAHLREPGYLAFHDVMPRWPGVWRTVGELLASGRVRKVERVGTLGIYQVSASPRSGTSSTPAVALNTTEVSPEPPNSR